MFEVHDDGVEQLGHFNVRSAEYISKLLNHSNSFAEISGECRSEEQDEGGADGLLAGLALADNGVLYDGPECEHTVVDGEGHVIVDIVTNALPGQVVFAPVDDKSVDCKNKQ